MGLPMALPFSSKSAMTFRMTALWLAVAFCKTPCLGTAAATVPDPLRQANEHGSVLAGKALFTGAQRFKNGGPACAACHTMAGLAFLNGGSLGPDLTGSYAKLGPVGLDAVMHTLYFPVMAPIFNTRPLTPQEQHDLKAFFAETQSAAPPKDGTPVLASLGFLGCLALLVITWGAGRSHPEPVRQSLLQQSTPAGTRHL